MLTVRMMARVFQSTGSVRSPTYRSVGYKCHRPISIHRLREEPDIFDWVFNKGYKISIHRLREEPDSFVWCIPPIFVISIHRLREEPDIS